MSTVTVPEFPLMTSALAKLSFDGGFKTVKVAILVAVPPGVVTVIGPVVAPEGTVIVMLLEVNVPLAATPLNRMNSGPE